MSSESDASGLGREVRVTVRGDTCTEALAGGTLARKHLQGGHLHGSTCNCVKFHTIKIHYSRLKPSNRQTVNCSMILEIII